MKDLKFKIIRSSVIKTARKSIGCMSRCFLPIIFASLALSLSCEREDMFTFAENRLSIGDTGPGGGIVFYVTDGGLHGLEVALSDQSTSQVWISPTTPQTTLNGNTSTAIGTGRANSNAIISQALHTGSAAQLCRDYNGGGKKDWFLPSKDELQEIWWNLVSDHSALNSGQGGPYAGSLGSFTAGYYWSSSENASNNAHEQSFSTGQQSYSTKGTADYVRAVRAF